MIRGRKLKRIGLALVGLFCAFWLINPANAHAGTYTVIECHPDYGVNAAPDARAIGSFFNDGGSYMTWSTAGCAQPNSNAGLWLQAFGNASGGSVYTTLGVSAPPGTYINGGTFRYAGWGDNFDTWSHTAYLLDHSGGVIQVWSGGYGNAPKVEDLQIPATGGSGDTLIIDQSCAQPSGTLCTGEDNISIKNLILRLADTSPPSVNGLSGSLVDSAVAHGLAGLRISASDAGGGIHGVSIDVNGQPIAGPATNCPGWRAGDGFAVRTRPCGDLDAALAVDTEHPPWRDGANALRVCVSDLSTAGPAYTSCAQRTVQVDNSCPDSSGADRQASSVNAGLEDPKSGALHRTRAARSTDGVALRGSVTADGAPVRGASVCIYETVDEPAGISQLVQVAKSTSNGGFGVNLPPGPSRTFEVAYRYGDHQIQAPTMHLDSSVVPTLGVTRKKLSNGHSVGFRGHLPGPHADGVAVALQARVGKKWRTFKQVTSERGGSFQGKYRFTQTHGSVLYVFRALVKKQGGYPYSQGASRKRKVLVQG